MARFIPRLNTELNFWDPETLNENFIKGFNGITTGFYVMHPENIESATPVMQVYRMDQLAMAISRLNEEYSLRLYCLQTPFDFSYEQNRMSKIIETEKDNKYYKKTAEVYKKQYDWIADKNNDMRQKIYVWAISSPNGQAKIRNFYDTIHGFLTKAGLNGQPASQEIIQRLFNEIFALPEEHQGYMVNNQQINFKTNKFLVSNFKEDGSLNNECWEQIINVKQTSPNFQPLDPFWLANLYEINDILVSFDVDALEEKKRDSFIGSLKTDFVNVRQYKSQIKNERIQVTREIIEGLIHDIATGNQDIKLVTLLIQIKAESKQKLRKKFEEVKRELDRMGLVYGNINFRQHEALEMLQPFRVGRQKGMNGLQKDIEMVFQTDAIANSYPFTQVSLFQKDGNLIATATSGSPIIFNICDPTPPNRNATVLGFSGSRKTTLLRTIILAQLLNPKNQQVLIMDFENEYTNLALNYKQQIIEFTRATGKDVPTINIFQVPNVDTWNAKEHKFEKEPLPNVLHDAFNDQNQHVENILRMILSKDDEKISINEINVLNTEIAELYKNKKITPTTNFNNIPNDKWPILDDLYNQIFDKTKKLRKKDEFNQLDDYIRMVRLLKPFTKDGVYDGIFNKHTNIKMDENAKLVVFNLFGLLTEDTSNEIKIAMLMSVLRYWSNVMIGQRRRWPEEKEPSAKFITFIVDEFHKLVDDQFPQGLKLLSQMYAQLRKYYSQIIVATQSISTFTKAKNEDIKRYLKQMIDSSWYKFILGMGESQLEDLNNSILYGSGSELTEGERLFLATSSNKDGGKFVLIIGDKERIAGRIYSASTNALPDWAFRVPFDKIEEPIQLWQRSISDKEYEESLKAFK